MEGESCCPLCLLHEIQALVGVDMPDDLCIRKPGEEIDRGVDVELPFSSRLDMDRVDLYEIS